MTKAYNKNRFREIVSIGSKYGFRNGIGSPKDFRLLLEELGPTFIKIGQVLSTRADLLPEVYINELKNLQDNVSPSRFENIEKVLIKELGDYKSNFEFFKKTPIASASLSEVYKGRLNSGEEVIIKVQRPNVKEKMYADIAILKKLAPFINITSTKEVVDIREVIEELDSAIKKELNFLEEKENIKLFHKNNSKYKSITSPFVYEELCTEKVLVMDYIAGIKIDNVDLLVKEGYDLKDISEKLIYNYFQQVFDSGFFHADPHPGNILIHNNTIGYIDFGLMGSLNRSILQKLNDMLAAAVKKDTNLLTKSILSIGIEVGEVNFNRLHHDISIIYNKYIDESIHNFDIGLMLNEIIAICRENNISMPKDITLLGKGMLTIQGVLSNLNKDMSIMEIAIPFFKNKIIEEKIKDFDLFDLGVDLYNNLNSIFEMPLKVNRILDKSYEGDLELNLKLDNMDRSLDRISSLANRLILAIIIVGLLISSSLIVQIDSLVTIGTFGYSLAGILSILVVLSMFRSKKRK